MTKKTGGQGLQAELLSKMVSLESRLKDFESGGLGDFKRQRIVFRSGESLEGASPVGDSVYLGAALSQIS